MGVGLIVVDAEGRVLLGRRIKAGEDPSWCLPGGHVEAGETIEQAAAREAEEEAGIDGTKPEVFAIGVQTTGSGVTAGAVATWPGTPPEVREPDVLESWGWYDPAALPEPLYPPSAMSLATWRGLPPPAGWRVYPVAAS
ncbi:NUDIX hydrolase [Actinoplanes friuliensis DSM 7358]|uniref:NUDIX hydrolase n=1 Tax=Actinoplanes friuliensis DSM 7358 TaxID=1246995 RepID=U5W0V0_9ACTN|nr:NUDIX hydrolase [Actinoplanes friuliensis DSM 7358]